MFLASSINIGASEKIACLKFIMFVATSSSHLKKLLFRDPVHIILKPINAITAINIAIYVKFKHNLGSASFIILFS